MGAGDPFTLNIANSLWGENTYDFVPEFLQMLVSTYDSPLRRVDFKYDQEGARQIINEWVSEKTEEMIPQLLSSGDITDLTRLVLVNAIYFNASWKYSFDEGATRSWAFSLPEGDIDVDMMFRNEHFRYGCGEDYQVIELPYDGDDTSMIVFLPVDGQFEQFEQGLTAQEVDYILSNLSYQDVNLRLPKFELDQRVHLGETLGALGMPDAFDRRVADFSGMEDPRDELNIDKVIHQATIIVDEAGTEAAAATAVIVVVTTSIAPPSQPVSFTADRPFIYMIRDMSTNSTLFMGRVSDASAFVA